MKLNINKHTPPPPPPVTYDLIGLDQQEMAVISALIGANCEAVTDAILAATALPTGGDVAKRVYDQLAEYRKLSERPHVGPYAVVIMTRDSYTELLHRGK